MPRLGLEGYEAIVETTDNRFWAVKVVADYEHCWIGVPVKLAKGGAYVRKAKARVHLVRKEGSRVVRSLG